MTPGRLNLYDGFRSLEGGMDSGRAPILLPNNKAAYLQDAVVRGGYPINRPGHQKIKLTASSATTAFGTGRFQGALFYDTGRGYLIASVGGLLYRFTITNRTAVVEDISISGDPNPSIISQAWLLQAENYVIVQDGQSTPIIFDGSNSRRSASDEVPVGSGPMAYGMGRIWVAQGRNYVAGDILGGTTGILKFTENTYIASGGAFTVPMQSGNITAMVFTATPDTALGQGELMIFTPDAVYTNVVTTDRTQWQNLQYPVQRVLLIKNGGLSSRSTTIVNGDVFMRARDGIRSVISAVRDFSQWGNRPISREMNRVLTKDTASLLGFSSAVLFDNRLLMTALPMPLPNGSYSTGIVALDFDLISGMDGNAPPAYDGLWTRINAMQLVTGRIDGG